MTILKINKKDLVRARTIPAPTRNQGEHNVSIFNSRKNNRDNYFQKKVGYSE
jgi:hypothetical protein